MIFTSFTTNREVSRYLVWKMFTGGLFLVALALLLIVVPQLVAYPLAVIFLIIAFYLFAGAWRVFWATRGMPSEEREYEDASFRELP